MKRLYYSILFLPFLAVLLSSCVKEVILDANEDPMMVVSCILSQDSVQTLKVSWTKGPAESEAPKVTDVVAVLTDIGEGREVGRFVRISDAEWKLDYAAIPTHRYRLEVSVPGHEPVWAEQIMPEAPVVESSVYTRSIPVSHGDKYGLLYNSSFSHTLWAWAENYDVGLKQHLPVNMICTDYPYVDNVNLSGEESNVSNWPKSWPPKDENNTYAYDEYCVYGHALHQRFLRFPKKESPSQELFAIGGEFKGNFFYYDDETPREPSGAEGILYFAYLSDEYDHYLCEASSQYQAEESDDLSSIYLRDNIYSNIHGGLGIFGAFSTTPVRWKNAYVRIVHNAGDDRLY
jgi:hypothetical protein